MGGRFGSVGPSPGRGETWIAYALPRAAYTRLSLHDVQGHELAVLADGVQAAGRQQRMWDGRIGRREAPARV
jgi:hypothetical protein